MLQFWSMAAISVYALHYQQKFGELGKSRETFLVALAYSIFCNRIMEYKLTFLTAIHIAVALWVMYIITLFSRRYETLDDDDDDEPYR